MGDEVGLGKSYEGTFAVGRVLELRQMAGTQEGSRSLEDFADIFFWCKVAGCAFFEEIAMSKSHPRSLLGYRKTRVEGYQGG
jgi:hypothetical protein